MQFFGSGKPIWILPAKSQEENRRDGILSTANRVFKTILDKKFGGKAERTYPTVEPIYTRKGAPCYLVAVPPSKANDGTPTDPLWREFKIWELARNEETGRWN